MLLLVLEEKTSALTLAILKNMHNIAMHNIAVQCYACFMSLAEEGLCFTILHIVKHNPRTIKNIIPDMNLDFFKVYAFACYANKCSGSMPLAVYFFKKLNFQNRYISSKCSGIMLVRNMYSIAKQWNAYFQKS